MSQATKNVVDLFMSFEEETLVILGLLLLIGHLSRLENLLYKSLESIAVLGLVLSLEVKKQMRSMKPSNSPGLGRYSL
jgi:uncharacterized integral membrane protein